MKKLGDFWHYNTRDLMRATTCQHCTELAIGHALKIDAVEERLAPHIEEQKRKKLAGEDKTLPMRFGDLFEEDLTRELITSLQDGYVAAPEGAVGTAGTISLMASRVPIIYQGSLDHAEGQTVFQGRPDFLVRSDWALEFQDGKLTAVQTEGDETKYTAWDAKYSSHAKPEYALQVAAYVDALDVLGFKAADAKHGLILGNRSLELLADNEIVPAMRLARAELESTISSMTTGGPSATQDFFQTFRWHCESAKECAICEYPDLCSEQRVAEDDLLLVAGLGKNLRRKFWAAGIMTMRELASPTAAKPNKVSNQTFEKVQAQARLQASKTSPEDNKWELLSDPMLQFLPKPSRMDVFFDMEGFPYFPGGGLEYLFGNWTDDEGFTGFWANTREEEREAFVTFMTWLIARMESDPTAHVFHYAPYERTALKRLSLRHAVMGPELAKLEEEARFVDLYPMVTKSLRVSEPRYSIKNLEKFYRFERSAGVQKADDSIDEYYNWRDLVAAISDPRFPAEERESLKAKERQAFENLKKYNTEDVQSTQKLFYWLLGFEGAATRFGENRIVAEEDDRQFTKSELELQELEALTAKFFRPLEGIPRGKSKELDRKIAAWEALAHSILFYRREDVMFWANLHIRLQQDDEAIKNDREALRIFDVSEVSRAEKVAQNGRVTTEATYVAQFDSEDLYEPEAGDDLIVRYALPGQIAASNFGKVLAAENGEISFTRDVDLEDHLVYTPDAILSYHRFLSGPKQTQLNHLTETITSQWLTPENEPPQGFPGLELLLRNSASQNEARYVSEDPLDYLPSLIRAMDEMDGSTLAVQGPPGTGKTYLASRLIEYLTSTGRNVAVTALSHSAIHNVLEACIDAGVDPAGIFKTKQKGDKSDYPWTASSDHTPTSNRIKRYGAPFVLGGTSFALCNKAMLDHPVDYLIVDEAAQFSMVDTLAVSGLARNIILFGDPQQLPQVVQAIHPGGVENSALGHFIGHNDIVPIELGFFVEVTRRLHPEINKHISWLAYENKLQSHPDTVSNEVPGTPPGLHPVAVQHSGNSTHSPEEVEEVLELVARHSATLPPEEILIVAPYNAQVNAIRKALDEQGFNEIQVGTVDKFQGREGMVVIVSLAASNADDAPRGLGFLLDRNRLNVAISRAKSVCYLVHSPDLLRANFSSLEDVKSVSRLARLSRH